jgi:hypothetical protein
MAKKSLFKPLLKYGSLLCCGYTLTWDFFIPNANKKIHFTNFQVKDERQIIVLGSDITALTSAYYLS